MKTEQVLLLLIIVVLGLLGWQTYRRLTTTNAHGAMVAPTAPATPGTVAAVTRSAPDSPPAFAAEAAPLRVEYVAEGTRDPFESLLPQEVGPTSAQQAAAEEVTLPALHLQGLVYGQLKPRAIIDGQVVGEGDRINDIEVLQIQRDGVLLFYQNRRFFLRPGPGTR